MLLLLVVAILIYLITQWGLAMRYNFIMIRSLQMIMHLPLVQISFPGNAISLISQMIPVVGFDILETIIDWEVVNESFSIFNFGEHEFLSERIFAQLNDIGYETFNAVMILNTIGIVLVLYVIKVILLSLFASLAFMCKNKYLKTKAIDWSKGLFFNQLISLYI